MSRYIVLIDGKKGAYGMTVPDLPGCTAMGRTIDEALANAASAMRDWAEVTEESGGVIPPPRKMEAVADKAGSAGGAQASTIRSPPDRRRQAPRRALASSP